MRGILNGNRRLLKIIVVLVVLCFTSCLSLTRTGLSNGGPIYDELVKSMMDMPNLQIAIDGMPGMVLLITSMVAISPDDPKLNGMAAMAYMAYGMLMEDTNKDYAMELYDIGESYGLHGFKSLDDDIKEGMEKEGKSVYDFLDKMNKDNMDIVFYYMMNKALKLFGNMESPYVMAELGDLMAVINKVAEIDPAYFFYAPAVFNAAIASMGGALMGTTPEKANEMFKEAFAKTNNTMLLGYWIYAQFYAVTIMDEKLFDETCKYVMDTPSSALKGGRLINEIAKLKVKKLMADKSKYF